MAPMPKTGPIDDAETWIISEPLATYADAASMFGVTHNSVRAQIADALGFNDATGAGWPKYWMSPDAGLIAARWQADLGLTEAEVIHVATQNARQFGNPASGPKTLNPHMQAYADAKAAPPMTINPAAGGTRREPATPRDRRQQDAEDRVMFDEPSLPDPIKSGTALRAEDIAAMCEGKAAFTSAQMAHKAAKRRRGIAREVYRRRACGQFHVGTPVEKRVVYRTTSTGITKWGKRP